jgi:hypothetical protein
MLKARSFWIKLVMLFALGSCLVGAEIDCDDGDVEVEIDDDGIHIDFDD